MLSVMTVVLPQHSKNSTNFSTSASASSSASSCAVASASTTTTLEASKAVARSTSATNRCQNCECLCGVENMTKNSLPQRCPFLKGYMVEPRRHPHFVDPTRQHHPAHVSTREWDSVREAACFWRDKYDRLYESQRRLQKVNEDLEEKLLKIADKFEGEKSDLTKDVSDLTSRLVEARLAIAELEEENEQYRNDCNIAVRLLQCKPSNFVAHKFNSLPADFQVKVKRHLSRNARSQKDGRAFSNSSLLLDQCPADVRTIKVSVPTLPPAAMVYSVNRSSPPAPTYQPPATAEETTPDHVSAAIIAKVLEERSLERKTASAIKKQRTQKSEESNKELLRNASTQTDYPRPNVVPYCNRCHAHPAKTGISSANRSNEPDIVRMSKDIGTSNSTETAI